MAQIIHVLFNTSHLLSHSKSMFIDTNHSKIADTVVRSAMLLDHDMQRSVRIQFSAFGIRATLHHSEFKQELSCWSPQDSTLQISLLEYILTEEHLHSLCIIQLCCVGWRVLGSTRNHSAFVWGHF